MLHRLSQSRARSLPAFRMGHHKKINTSLCSVEPLISGKHLSLGSTSGQL
jgi:hypothetical protein